MENLNVSQFSLKQNLSLTILSLVGFHSLSATLSKYSPRHSGEKICRNQKIFKIKKVSMKPGDDKSVSLSHEKMLET